jgi:ABC-type transport system involved in multi-copper enzyme maturation permease subunit
MISVPILFREYRAAARRKRTFVLRCVFSGFLAVVFLFFGFAQFAGAPNQAAGRQLLKLFSWQLMILMFIFAPALTCGCISDERRQGTLGLLFLTRLTPADIVLGKFAGKTLDLLLLVLSAIPLLFVPVLLGGVDWDQTLSSVLSISALLVLASSLGVFCSTMARNTGTSVAIAYGVLLGWATMPILLPLMKKLPWQQGNGGFWRIFPDHLALASPFYTLSRGILHNCWITSLWCGGAAIILLALSIWRLPALVGTENFRQPFWRSMPGRLQKLARPKRGSRNAEQLSRNPILWLHFSRDRNRWLLQAVIAAAICGATGFGFTRPRWDQEVSVMLWLGGLAGLFFLKILIVLHIARSFAAEKEDGALE